MKKTLFAALAAMFMVTPTLADNTGWYGSLGVGASFGDGDTVYYPSLDTGYDLNGAVGYDAGNWRGELEVAYIENSATFGPYTVTGSAVAVTVNAFYDIALDDSWTLSLGAGAGVAVDAGIKVGDIGDTSTELTYKGAVQIAYDVNDSTQAYLGYTYRGVDDASDYGAHSVGVGLRIYFGA
jgi:hypothetical protein